MDNKLMTYAAIVIAAIVLVIVANVIINSHGGDNDDPVTEGVIYIGNGGEYNGETKYGDLSTTVLENRFVYGDHAFINWNTKEDGTGVTYNVGNSISYNPKTYLYAQWGISASFEFHAGGLYPGYTNLTHYIVGENDYSHPIGVETFALPADGSATYTVEGGYDWSYDEESKIFIGSMDGDDKKYRYELTTTLGDATVVDCYVKDGKPCIDFTYSADVKGSINLHGSVVI